MRRAVIDIGTNTVKLLVADVAGHTVTVVTAKDETTRLGEGVDASKRLLPPAIARTVSALSRYAADARELGATDIIALTTSAARDAGNRDDFLRACRDIAGIEVRVITGEQEAELIFRGASSDPAWSSDRLLVMDVGGGSAEFIEGAAGKIERRTSLPVGAVRVTEKFGEANFSAMMEFLRMSLTPALAKYDLSGRKMIATGGTAVTLARVARGASDHVALTQDDVRAEVSRLYALPVAERRKVPGLPPERADIIVAGGLVFVVAMELLGAYELTVSIRGLRHGALLG